MNYDIETNTKSVVSSMMWKLLERFFAEGINLVIQIVLARLLLPSDFGNLAIIVAVVNYASQFVQAGLATALVQKKELEDIDVSTLLTSSLVVATFFYIILFCVAPLISAYYGTTGLIWPFRVQSLILIFNGINSVQTAILSRQMRFKTLFIRSVIAIPVSGGIGIAMAYAGFGLWALIAQSLSNAFLVVMTMYIGSGIKLSLRFSWSHAKTLYSFSGKILLTSLISGFSDTIRTMIIGKKYLQNELAYYDKAYTYSNYMTNIVNNSISSVLLPTFSRKQSQKNDLKLMARKSVRMTSYVMFPVLAGVFSVAKPLVLVLLTEKWLACVPFLMLFCVLRAPGCLTSIDKQVYYAIGKSEISLVYGIGLLIANLVSLSITVPISPMAIAVGATIVEVIGCLVYFVISSKVYDYKLSERVIDLIKPLINSVIMAIAVMYVGKVKINNVLLLMIQCLTGVIIYIVLSLITKDDNFVQIINMIRNRFSKGEN